MIFRSIITHALLLGLVTGIFLSITQHIGVTPIIFAAEAFEQGEEPQQAHAHAEHHDDHHDEQAHSHSHDTEAWAPEDGAERTFYTYVSNVLAAIGFAAVLLALMTQVHLQGHLQGVAKISIGRGLLWGSAGFIALFLVPGIGLPPEIPGIEAAVIGSRQNWWVLAVVSAAVGLGVIAFAPSLYKAGGAVLLALPFLVGAPHPAGPAFTHPDPKVVESLTSLHQQFIIASGISSLMFWLLLGAACAWVLQRWSHEQQSTQNDVVRAD
jgi:cobalt transporter subunit CbtA